MTQYLEWITYYRKSDILDTDQFYSNIKTYSKLKHGIRYWMKLRSELLDFPDGSYWYGILHIENPMGQK